MAIVGIDMNLCVGCGSCDRACPMDVIYFDKEKRIPEIRYPKECQSCFLCLVKCPEKCIEITAERGQRLPGMEWRELH